MKRIVAIAAAAIVFASHGAAPFFTEPGALDPAGGHVQGACTDGEFYYLSQMTGICKFDRSGKLVKRVAAVCHTGDICWHDGRLYSSVAVYQGPHKDKGMIQVFDRDLKLVREKLLDRPTDGIAFLNGVLYVGGGSNLETVPHTPGQAPQSKTPHRENVILRLDPETLEVIGRAVIDYGYKTRYGVQNIATDGRQLYLCFYAVKGAPGVAVYGPDLKLQGTIDFTAGNGFDALPGAAADGKTRFFACQTINSPDKPLRCRITFYELDGKVMKEM